ncbi:DNA-binding response regulator [Clostridium sporogenes]|uniref:DNA-binding response regulator n=1 Tax=Clostridium sporogenes TaxID=1509 RepID=UPI0013D748EE|nr:DNA-binding response regulator [Clostridium sporogenes]NFQ86839.1 DNA-binding response regulator [Clostridium sporogenes]
MKETYKNLLELIKINENIKHNCESNLRLIERFLLKQGPKGFPSGTSYLDADCIHGSKGEMHVEDYGKLMNECEKLKNMIFLQDNILEGLYKTKKNIDEKLKNLKGIKYDVAYLKLVEGYSIQAIASKLNISESYAMKISAKI